MHLIMVLGLYCLIPWTTDRRDPLPTHPGPHYSQLDKEALAIVSGVKKFHNYVYGRHFTIQSDHQPYLFNEQKGIPQHASSRIQRWALMLSAYCYSIRYKAGKTLNNADALSRLPRPVTASNSNIPADVEHLINHLSTTCICAANIKEWTSKGPHTVTSTDVWMARKSTR